MQEKRKNASAKQSFFQLLIPRTPFSSWKNCTPFFLLEIEIILRIRVFRSRGRGSLIVSGIFVVGFEGKAAEL